MKDLIHIVYVSYTVETLSEQELDFFLQTIRKKNTEMKVTGLLLYNNDAFIQVIEGDRVTIENLFNIIKEDSRHTNVVLLLTENIESRDFPDWPMGYQRIDTSQTKKIPGFSDYMINPDSHVSIKGSSDQVLHLLNSFKKYT